jgi:putative two-component system response regulator
MHDVGKIGVPDNILLKTGKLDSHEWDVMKSHTELGGLILEGSKNPFIQLATTIAVTHHEKWDGTGYPKGLKGNDIPIEGRITAIADVFDALTTRRPYKEAFSVEKAFAIIRESSGSHFDPEVVDAFFSVQNEILSIKNEILDGDNVLSKLKIVHQKLLQ